MQSEFESYKVIGKLYFNESIFIRQFLHQSISYSNFKLIKPKTVNAFQEKNTLCLIEVNTCKATQEG